jgi:D-tyrosyl-tRNA(Tyr) deacylase
MLALLQRVAFASVDVAGARVAAIGPGLLVFVGVERDDDERRASRLAERVLGYRVFSDPDGKMNLSVRDTGGEVLLVPQFTLAADTRKGTRASFTSAAAPAEGRRLFERLVEEVRRAHPRTACGVFGAHMRVTLENDGPVTFLLDA